MQIAVWPDSRDVVEEYTMITKPTVLILGAGASMPYGFLSGEELVKIIEKRDEVYWEKSIRKGKFYLYGGFGYKISDYLTFRRELLKSHQSSVDAFLEWRSEFMEIGKLVIADILIEHENQETLARKEENRWYTGLLNRKLSGSSLEEFTDNKLSVITFNYDRSFEQFLFMTLQSRYAETSIKKVADVVNKIEIVHVHGTLGRLSWREGDGDIREYETNITSETLKVAAGGIKIVTDAELDKSDEFNRARELLLKSEIVFFLGFGYLKANIERLRELDTSMVIRGTVLGLTDPEIDKLSADYKWLSVTPKSALPIHEYMREDGLFVRL